MAKSKRLFKLSKYTIAAIAVIIVIALWIIGMFLRFPYAKGFPIVAKGRAMEPTYHTNEYYATIKVHANTVLKRGDVVVYRSPKAEGVEFFKRIIGVSGDTIRIAGGKVYLNDQELSEPYLAEPNTQLWQGGFIVDNMAVKVPQDSYFVMGDNRAHSSDSRETGFIRHEDVLSIMGRCYSNCSDGKDHYEVLLDMLK